ncbi:MAG: beta-propeller fold lactonase family protein [Acetobacteraceae bacterium]|nr:beta-propeller fold lactonase family protein [Acetobacteraceae bacterium]
MITRTLLLAGLIASAPMLAQAGRNDILIGVDQKIFFEANGQRIGPGGSDALLVMDVSDPANPRIRASLPLTNSVLGPPTNLAITPDGRLGLLANSVVTAEKDGKWTTAPDDKLYVVDLDANPPRLIDTVTVGKQPSGLAISRNGRLALIANRAGKSISVLSIDGTTVRPLAEVPIGDEVSAVAISPDGKRGYAAKNTVDRIAVLTIDGQTVTYDKAADMPAGTYPYNLDVTPDGRIAIASNQGSLPGNVDTWLIIEAGAKVPHVIDQVAVGDGPEGFAISPDGQWAASPLLRGSGAKHDSWAYTRDGGLTLARIADGKVRVVNTLPAGALPEGIAFSPNSRYLYIGNYLDKNVQIYRIRDGRLVDTGKKLALPGQPASMRGPAR